MLHIFSSTFYFVFFSGVSFRCATRNLIRAPEHSERIGFEDNFNANKFHLLKTSHEHLFSTAAVFALSSSLSRTFEVARKLNENSVTSWRCTKKKIRTKREEEKSKCFQIMFRCCWICIRIWIWLILLWNATKFVYLFSFFFLLFFIRARRTQPKWMAHVIHGGRW